MATLPSLTRLIDNAFLDTWYEIRADAIDNILESTPIWAMFVENGVLKPQIGEDFITRTIRYDKTDPVEVKKGDLLPSGDTEAETMAIWTWRTLASHVQRSAFDDQRNRGMRKIKDYVGLKLSLVRDGLEQKIESQLYNSFASDEVGTAFQGFDDMMPPIGSLGSGTYGKITRPTSWVATVKGTVKVPNAGNTWWASRYLPQELTTIEDTMLDDMRLLWNTVTRNQLSPNVIVTTQSLFEIYEIYAVDVMQIIKGDNTFLADLGFQTLYFKGAPIVWSDNMTANHMFMLNTDFIDVVYDPDYWFDMTDWKAIPMQTDRIAHIMNFSNMLTTQPRRHGRLEYS